MKQDQDNLHKKNNGVNSESDDFWSFDDLFAAKEEENQREVQMEEQRREQARRQAAEKARASSARRSADVTKDDGQRPDLQEFSDTQKMSYNRLKPEIRLTSVEPEIREDTQYTEIPKAQNRYTEYEDDGAYDEDYEDGAYEDGYEDDEYDDGAYDEEYDDAYGDDEYDEEYADEYDEAYDDGYEEDYDDGYDYDYEEEPEAGNDTESVTDVQPAYDYDAEEDEPDDSGEKNRKPLIIAIVSVIVVLLLAAGIILVIKSFSGNGANQESSELYQLRQVTGVVTGIDKNNESFLVYNAESGQEQSFSMKDSSAEGLTMGSLFVGDVVQVQYKDSGNREVTSLLKASQAEKLENVKGAVPQGNGVTINGKYYTIDDKLVCLYQGQAYDVRKINENTSYTATAFNGHVYTIVITDGTGTLKLENLDGYEGATLRLIPEGNEIIEVTITKNMEDFQIPEGSLQIQIIKDGETVYSGKTFISAGMDNTVKLPQAEEKKGKVVFVTGSNASMTIQIDGKQYTSSDEIELKYGEYTAKITAPGYEDVTKTFTIDQPYQQVTVEFKANSTQVTISTSLWGVSLYVDGVYQGELEGNSISCNLAPGTHTITCTRTGYHDQHQTIVITEGMEDQMLYFSGFVAVESPEESSNPEEEQSESEGSSEDGSSEGEEGTGEDGGETEP